MRQGFGMTETTLATFASELHDPGAVGHVTAHSEAKVGDQVYRNENKYVDKNENKYD